MNDYDDMPVPSHAHHSRLSRALIALPFPSDTISVKHLRAGFPERFDVEPRDGEVFGDYFFVDWTDDPAEHDRNTKHLRALGDLLSCERALAAHLLAEADGVPLSPAERTDKEATKSLLVKYYQNLKVAGSEPEAQKLVEKIEADVHQYAESHKRGR